MTTSITLFIPVSLVMVYWFVFLQYYWFPQLRPWHAQRFYLVVSVSYTTVEAAILYFTDGAWAGLPALGLLLGEILLMKKPQRQYVPAFLTVSILAYIATEFVDAVSIFINVLLTSFAFAATLQGVITTLTFNCILFTLISLILLPTRAPMENLIQGLLGRMPEYLLLGFMLCIGIVFLTTEVILSQLTHSWRFALMLAILTGVLLTGIALCTYILTLMHLQQEHTHAQRQEQLFQEQYTTELERQMQQVKKFRHDYQNMLMGLGGYLKDRDYRNFELLYIDIRSKWTTSNASELTIEDLDNVPKIGVRYTIYHNYLLARQMGIQFFVNVPQPVMGTVDLLRQLGQLIDRTVPLILPEVAQQALPMITLVLETTPKVITYRLVFAVPKDAQIRRHNQLLLKDTTINFARVTRGITVPATLSLALKQQWGQLTIRLPQ